MKQFLMPDGVNYGEGPDNWTQEMFNKSLEGLATEEAQQGHAGQPTPPHVQTPIKAMFPQNNAPAQPPPFVQPQHPASDPNARPGPSMDMFPQAAPLPETSPILSSEAPKLQEQFIQPQRPHSQVQTAESTPASRNAILDNRPLFDQINDPKGVNMPQGQGLGPENQGVALNKAITTTLRGAGEFGSNAFDSPDIARQHVENWIAAAQGQPVKQVVWPASKAYENAAPAIPPGYEKYNEFGKIAAPIAVEVALSGGSAIPAMLGTGGVRSVLPRLRSIAADPGAAAASGLRTVGNIGKSVVRNPIETVAAPAARMASQGAVDYIGGQYGSELGKGAGWAGDRLIDFGKKSLGYDTSTPTNMLEPGGELLGGTLTGRGIRDAANASLGFLRTERSKSLMDAADRINARLRAEGRPEIPFSMGMFGSKGAGMIEDWTARGIISGKAAQEARRGQYAALEDAVVSAADEVRGSPAFSHITKETIGGDLHAMANREDRDSRAKVGVAQQQMIGNSRQAGTFLDPSEFHQAMGNLADPANRSTSAKTKAQAAALDAEVRANYTQPKSGIGPPMPPNFEVLKDVRTDLGHSLAEGTRLSKKVKGPAYETLTNVMRRGSGTTNFDQVEEWTKERLQGLEKAQKIRDAPDAGTAYDKGFKSKTSNSLDRLKVYNDANAASPELPKIMADNLELKTRGNNAGLPVDPSTWTPEQMSNWDAMSPEAKSAYTGGNPDLERHLNDVSTLAKADLARPGGRSKPGKVGSTIGTMGPLGGIGALLGGAGGFLHGGDLKSALTGAAGVAPLLMAGGNRALGGLLTNEKLVRRVINNPAMSPIRKIGSAAGGLSTVLQKYGKEAQAQEAQKKQQAIDEARVRRLNETGGVE